jgi:hypothetical protein
MGSGRHPVAAMVSYQLGGPDGVSIEATKWRWALGELGFAVRTVAGAGDADVLVPGLQAGTWLTGRSAPPPPVDRDALEEALCHGSETALPAPRHRLTTRPGCM